MEAELQTIPARHGVATFVPAGRTIRIINTSGTQVVDTWAFALPRPEAKKDDQVAQDESQEKTKNHDSDDKKRSPPDQRRKVPKRKNDFPSQEEAEKLTKHGLAQAEKEDRGQKQKGTWSAYVPSIEKWTSRGQSDQTVQTTQGDDGETEQQKSSRAWASYFPSGKAISSYIPRQASDTVSAFTASHHRDQSKPYLAQLRDFSRTPVGAAGLAALSGSTYTSSLYAGYQAWNLSSPMRAAVTEFLSMAHTRVSTGRWRPEPADVLVTNVRGPILVFLEDTSGCAHDTLVPACDPSRYRELGVEGWEGHGSCAENLVLALRELNETAGLEGASAVGAEVTVDSAPAPWNLFMNVVCKDDGGLRMEGPVGGKGGFVRLRAERDVVVVMSACPQDVTGISGKELADAHFVVEEEGEGVTERLGRARVPRRKTVQGKEQRPLPGKLSLSVQGTRREGNTGASAPARKKPIPQKVKTQKTLDDSEEAESKADAVARPRKKPIPPTTSRQSTNTSSSGAGERKKPRKLAIRPK